MGERVVYIVGAGLRGTALLERMMASVDEVLPHDDLHVHLVDPHPPGPGGSGGKTSRTGS